MIAFRRLTDKIKLPRQNSPCPANVIMSYFAKVEMSSFGDARMSFLRGGHCGRRGRYHVSAEGVKEVACDSEGIGEGAQAGGGGEDSFVKLPVDPEVRAAGQGGGGSRGCP
jgi:hypothetical protein